MRFGKCAKCSRVYEPCDHAFAHRKLTPREYQWVAAHVEKGADGVFEYTSKRKDGEDYHSPPPRFARYVVTSQAFLESVYAKLQHEIERRDAAHAKDLQCRDAVWRVVDRAMCDLKCDDEDDNSEEENNNDDNDDDSEESDENYELQNAYAEFDIECTKRVRAALDAAEFTEDERRMATKMFPAETETFDVTAAVLASYMRARRRRNCTVCFSVSDNKHARANFTNRDRVACSGCEYDGYTPFYDTPA